MNLLRKIALFLVLMPLIGCAANPKIDAVAKPLCPPNRVLDDFAKYPAGSVDEKFVIDFVIQQELLGGIDHWRTCEVK